VPSVTRRIQQAASRPAVPMDGRHRLHQQSIAALHQHVAQVPQLGFHPSTSWRRGAASNHQPRFRITDRQGDTVTPTLAGTNEVGRRPAVSALQLSGGGYPAS